VSSSAPTRSKLFWTLSGIARSGNDGHSSGIAVICEAVLDREPSGEVDLGISSAIHS
jgi:hypothetical protein